jgi:deoxyribodipyrimidine photo-lyase
MPVEVVWFKKDLRSRDHQPLTNAALSGKPVLCLFALEPERFDQPDTDPIHIEWELDCAVSLSKKLEHSGASLHYKIGNIIEILDDIHKKYEISRLISHEETGNSWSFERDKSVSKWCNSLKIIWDEYPSNGVVRKLKNRDWWTKERNLRMNIPLLEPPKFNSSIIYDGEIPTMEDLGLNAKRLENRPIPGEDAALERLHYFLYTSGEKYNKSISSPTLSTKHGSGLSPYFSAGVLSMRRVVHETSSRIEYIRKNKSKIKNHSVWLKSLSSFRRRLAWRCHFIQKLETEPNLDTVAQNPVIEKNMMRVLNTDNFNHWKNGTTGWPFLDACMRQLNATGWINFRMRAMIMSAASYNLWLPWKDTGNFLATQFLDYEPGIHWPQVGMQSGTTGINTIRAYSMTKQGKDHDKNGEYIRTWIPELSMVPTDYIHEPWLMTNELQDNITCRIGIEYPLPLVDEVESRKKGIKRSYSARSGEEARRISKKVLLVHGSRKKPRKKIKKEATIQKKLF